MLADQPVAAAPTLLHRQLDGVPDRAPRGGGAGFEKGAADRLEAQYATGKLDRLSALAAELVDLKVDVLVAASASSAQAAKDTTKTVPIVFMGEPDPVGTRLAASLAHPGGNVTGLADAHADLIPKRLQLLTQVTAPGTRVGVLWQASSGLARRGDDRKAEIPDSAMERAIGIPDAERRPAQGYWCGSGCGENADSDKSAG